MKKVIYLSLIAVIMAAAISVISCTSNENPVRLSQSETIIKYETNTVYKTNDTANTIMF